MRKRVGFILDPTTWLGGLNYFRNLFIAISMLPDGDLVPVVITGRKSTALDSVAGIEIVHTSMMNRWTFAWFARKAIVKVFGEDRLLHRLMGLRRIEVLSHSGPLVRTCLIPVIGWIPDFQHVHLPNLFSDRERRTRDREFHRWCESCDAVIVSSASAMADLEVFSPEHAKKGRILHFVASPPREQDVPSSAELRHRYALDRPFFLLPNQFWIHKNHRIVILALMLLREKKRHVTVLATGNTSDHRQPGFFASLMQYAEECGVADRFRVLGVVPFLDLSGLMRDSVALINPSRFEGWSTSVEEAKSIGKHIVLSDIPVHREQAPAASSYFAPDDAERLAEILWMLSEQFDPRESADARAKALASLPDRQLKFADCFRKIIMH